MGINVVFGFFPWQRALHYAAYNDNWDGSVGWVKTMERLSLFYYSDEPVVMESRVFFHLKNYSFNWQTIDDLENIRIGATIGYIYGDEFQKAEKLGRIDVQRVSDDLTNLKKLIHGRIEIFPIERKVAEFLLEKYFHHSEKQLITYHPRPITQLGYYFILAKKNKVNFHLMQLFNKGMQELKENGLYDKLYNDNKENFQYLEHHNQSISP